MSPIERERISWFGALLALGVICLLLGMLLFWLKCDTSSKLSRAIWFVLLLAGMGFGTQIAYYAVVYLPAVRKKLRNIGSEAADNSPTPVTSDPGTGTPESNKRRKLFGPFGWALIGGWGLLFLTLAAMFAFPKAMSHLLRPIAEFFCIVASFADTWEHDLLGGSVLPSWHEAYASRPQLSRSKPPPLPEDLEARNWTLCQRRRRTKLR